VRPLRESPDELLETDRPRPSCSAIEAVGETAEDVEVAFDEVGDAGALNLYNYLAAIVKPRRISLRNRRGTERDLVKLGEDLFRGPDIRGDNGTCCLEVSRRCRFLKRGQLVRHGWGYQLGLLRHGLAQLDEKPTRVLE
jgi:hypothetical protein